MFSLFKADPSKKLAKQRAALLEKAMLAQRKGDIRGYSQLTAEAEALQKQIEDLGKAGA